MVRTLGGIFERVYGVIGKLIPPTRNGRPQLQNCSNSQGSLTWISRETTKVLEYLLLIADRIIFAGCRRCGKVPLLNPAVKRSLDLGIHQRHCLKQSLFALRKKKYVLLFLMLIALLPFVYF